MASLLASERICAISALMSWSGRRRGRICLATRPNISCCMAAVTALLVLELLSSSNSSSRFIRCMLLIAEGSDMSVCISCHLGDSGTWPCMMIMKIAGTAPKAWINCQPWSTYVQKPYPITAAMKIPKVTMIWCTVVMVPRVAGVAISDSRTEGMPLAMPTPTPETRRPAKSAYIFPVHESAAPMMKKLLLPMSVRRLPYCCEGMLPTRLPTQAPTMVREVASCASSVDRLISLYMVPLGHELSVLLKQSEPLLLSPVTKHAFRHEKTNPNKNDCDAIRNAARHMDIGISSLADMIRKTVRI
mmetsp:Transcript_31964/g.70429  ORF Transcript_31964/g.70429 Transcript_31964/m.70429 type:complete len:302 (+) Transcript_31964:3203-4108(+)